MAYKEFTLEAFGMGLHLLFVFVVEFFQSVSLLISQQDLLLPLLLIQLDEMAHYLAVQSLGLHLVMLIQPEKSVP